MCLYIVVLFIYVYECTSSQEIGVRTSLPLYSLNLSLTPPQPSSHPTSRPPSFHMYSSSHIELNRSPLPLPSPPPPPYYHPAPLVVQWSRQKAPNTDWAPLLTNLRWGVPEPDQEENKCWAGRNYQKCWSDFSYFIQRKPSGNVWSESNLWLCWGLKK